MTFEPELFNVRRIRQSMTSVLYIRWSEEMDYLIMQVHLYRWKTSNHHSHCSQPNNARLDASSRWIARLQADWMHKLMVFEIIERLHRTSAKQKAGSSRREHVILSCRHFQNIWFGRGLWRIGIVTSSSATNDCNSVAHPNQSNTYLQYSAYYSTNTTKDWKPL